MISDKEFLLWIYERLHFVHKEDEATDYMSRLREIVDYMDPENVTPNLRDKSEMD